MLGKTTLGACLLALSFIYSDAARGFDLLIEVDPAAAREAIPSTRARAFLRADGAEYEVLTSPSTLPLSCDDSVNNTWFPEWNPTPGTVNFHSLTSNGVDPGDAQTLAVTVKKVAGPNPYEVFLRFIIETDNPHIGIAVNVGGQWAAFNYANAAPYTILEETGPNHAIKVIEKSIGTVAPNNNSIQLSIDDDDGVTEFSRAYLVGIRIPGLALSAAGQREYPPYDEDAKVPNVLFIICDQFRAEAISRMHGLAPAEGWNEGGDDTRVISTPHLDELAGDGVMFSNCYASNPVCTPNRAALITGQYSHRTGAITDGRMLNPGLTGIAQITKAAGFATGHIGKWHLNVGLYEEQQLAGGFVAPGGNRRHGFDYFAGSDQPTEYSSSTYYLDDRKKRNPLPVDIYEPIYQTQFAKQFISRHKNMPWHLVLSFGPPHTPHDEEDVPDCYWERVESSDLLKRRENVPDDNYDPDCAIQGNEGDYWKSCLWHYKDDDCSICDGAQVCGCSTNDPWIDCACVPDRVTSCDCSQDCGMIREAYFENYMRGYYAQILQIDDAVGELVRHLKAEGLYDDTLIVFTSDHGENGGSHGLYDKGVAFHEAAHVPAIFAGWDGIKHKGKVFDSLMSSVDIPVTIVHALELEATALGSPFIRKADGVNYSEYLTAQNPPRNSPRDHVYLQGRLNHTDNSPGNLNPSWRAIYTKDMIGLEGQWLYWMDAFTGEDRSLFHLFDGSGEAEDPFQRCNLVNQAQYGSELALLRARLDALRLDPGFGETVPHSLNPANGQRDVKWQKDGKVNVRWHGAAALPEDNEPRATVESYQVKWGTSPSDCDNGTVIPIENKDQADLNIGGAFGTFYWRVVAIPNEGDERPGECYSFTTIKDLAYSGGNPVHCESSNNDSVGPVPKEGMSVEPLDGDGNALSQFARLTWEGGSCARNYDVFIGFPGQSLTEIEHTTHLLSVVPAKATVPFQILPGKTHEWRVDARDGDGSARGPVNVTFQASNKLLFRASADAWVESGSRGRFGFEKKLSVSGRNPGPERHSYLRFDVEVPPNYEVDASRLRVFCLTAVDFGVYDCANGFFDCDNWPEGEMSGYEGLKKGALVTTGGGSKNEWATLELGKFLTSGGVRTFVLATMDPRERKLASRESRYVPFLELEVHELNP